MQIHNLTGEQVQMLDTLWALDSLEDIENFKRELPRFRQQQVDILLELVRLQALDDVIDNNPFQEFDNINDLLKDIQNSS